MIDLFVYNIFYGKKLEEISQWFSSLETFPDIICFQEFPKKQAQKFIRIFPGSYKFEYAKGFRHKGEDYGELTVYNSSVLQLKSVSVVQFGREPLFLLGGYSVNRTSLVTQFLTKQRKNFIIANTHLTWLGRNSLRINQLKKVVHVFNESDFPGIIVGDFNYSSYLGKKKLFNFMEDNQFKIAIEEIVTHSPNFFGKIKLPFIQHQLDYVFYKNCVVKKADVLKLPYSDHLPTIASVSI